MEIFTLNHLNQLIVDNIHKIRQIPFDVIVHLPRSGTIPASLLATYLCKPLASVHEFCDNQIITRKSEYTSLDRILIVDDSINKGIQLQQAIDIIKKHRPEAKIKILAIYSNKDGEKYRKITPDLILHEHGHNGEGYMMPWFMWKTKWIKSCTLDMDGVLCRDCTKQEDDDGQRYLQFLKNVEQKFKPMHPVGSIVTARLEKYRKETEEWLSKNGVQYGQLIMGYWNTKDERKKHDVGLWKANVYKELDTTLFIESDLKQSITISENSKKSVWCIDTQTYFKAK